MDEEKDVIEQVVRNAKNSVERSILESYNQKNPDATISLQEFVTAVKVVEMLAKWDQESKSA